MPAQAVKQPKKARPNQKLPAKMRGFTWAKGKSGNPAGRKPGTGISDALLQIMREPDGNTGLTGAQAIALATFKLAKRGHPVALREVWERVEGKVKVELDITVESSLWQRLNQGRARLQPVLPAVIERTFDEVPEVIEAEVCNASNEQLTDLDKSEDVPLIVQPPAK